MRGILLWLIGIPIPIIILLWLCFISPIWERPNSAVPDLGSQTHET